jgi:mono/diheme cytochrome c family protein
MRPAFIVLSAALIVGGALAMAGCPKTEKVDADAGASSALAIGGGDASADATPKASANVDARVVLVNGCFSCHSEHMLAQQRLTQAQWQKVVTKMVGWGANVEPAEVGPLVAYLSTMYGPHGATYEPETLTPTDAVSELAVMPDDPLPAGNIERGKPLFIEKCAGCHGADARGATGVNLVDRPILYRAADVTKMIRKGRGKMLPITMADAEIADVLAHLRSLKNPLP